ncbi:MAG: WecB/TagA/CpsF family glycosyltransferase [bacterium]
MTCKILNIDIETISKKQILEKIKSFSTSPSFHHIITANSIMIAHASQSDELKEVFKRSSLVIADSIGLIWASRLLNQEKPVLFPGIDLMMECIAYAEDARCPIFLIGAKPEIIEQAVVNIKDSYPNIRIAGYQHGYFTHSQEEALFSTIKQKRPAFVFVGLDTPRQEWWISRHLEKIHAPVVIGIGGSLDVISGKLLRAPSSMRLWRLEWLFRTIQQPWRILRLRYLVLFSYLVLKEKLLYNKDR